MLDEHRSLLASLPPLHSFKRLLELSTSINIDLLLKTWAEESAGRLLEASGTRPVTCQSRKPRLTSTRLDWYLVCPRTRVEPPPSADRTLPPSFTQLQFVTPVVYHLRCGRAESRPSPHLAAAVKAAVSQQAPAQPDRRHVCLRFLPPTLSTPPTQICTGTCNFAPGQLLNPSPSCLRATTVSIISPAFRLIIHPTQQASIRLTWSHKLSASP